MHCCTYRTHIWPIAWFGHLWIGMSHSWEQWNELLAALKGVEGVRCRGWGVWMWPSLGGTAGSLSFTARPFQTDAESWIIWAAHPTVMSTLACLLWCFWRDVMIKCVNRSCGEFISKVLTRGVARETPDRILLRPCFVVGGFFLIISLVSDTPANTKNCQIFWK